jgi:hypothetical protein
VTGAEYRKSAQEIRARKDDPRWYRDARGHVNTTLLAMMRHTLAGDAMRDVAHLRTAREMRAALVEARRVIDLDDDAFILYLIERDATLACEFDKFADQADARAAGTVQP